MQQKEQEIRKLNHLLNTERHMNMELDGELKEARDVIDKKGSTLLNYNWLVTLTSLCSNNFDIAIAVSNSFQSGSSAVIGAASCAEILRLVLDSTQWHPPQICSPRIPPTRRSKNVSTDF